MFDVNFVLDIIYLLVYLYGKGKTTKRKHKESKNMKDFLTTMRADEVNNSASPAGFLGSLHTLMLSELSS